MQILFHGSPVAHVLFKEGIRAGCNENGGTHGIYTPRVCLTASFEVAKRYGMVVAVDVDGLTLHVDTDRDGVFFYVDDDIPANHVIKPFIMRKNGFSYANPACPDDVVEQFIHE